MFIVKSVDTQNAKDDRELHLVELGSLENAFRFIRALPEDVPLPEVSVDPDGEIDFEWYSERSTASVSIGSELELSFAYWGRDVGEGAGELKWDGSRIPIELLDLINRIGGTFNS